MRLGEPGVNPNPKHALSDRSCLRCSSMIILVQIFVGFRRIKKSEPIRFLLRFCMGANASARAYSN